LESAYLTTCGLAVTLTFELLTSKSNQFISVLSYCTKVDSWFMVAKCTTDNT